MTLQSHNSVLCGEKIRNPTTPLCELVRIVFTMAATPQQPYAAVTSSAHPAHHVVVAVRSGCGWCTKAQASVQALQSKHPDAVITQVDTAQCGAAGTPAFYVLKAGSLVASHTGYKTSEELCTWAEEAWHHSPAPSSSRLAGGFAGATDDQMPAVAWGITLARAWAAAQRRLPHAFVYRIVMGKTKGTAFVVVHSNETPRLAAVLKVRYDEFASSIDVSWVERNTLKDLAWKDGHVAPPGARAQLQAAFRHLLALDAHVTRDVKRQAMKS